ncbi:peroxisomal assembly protein [Mycoemilia scoparia]|uniref:Peroxisomal ATPase PEX6 n=1 Tax=Mycoemilia scoparia TaxID=417184 RepID=A0A9W7ZSK9_9FUNG|nr:peroxisomal assembly protein [Mycoemilia scoparia]
MKTENIIVQVIKNTAAEPDKFPATPQRRDFDRHSNNIENADYDGVGFKCTISFPQGFSSTEIKAGKISVIDPIRLSEIVIGISNPDAYAHFESSTRPTLVGELIGMSPVISQGQSIPLKYLSPHHRHRHRHRQDEDNVSEAVDVRCLATQPVGCGLINPGSTKIIVVKLADSQLSAKPNNAHLCSSNSNGSSQPSSLFGDEYMLDAESFIINSLGGDPTTATSSAAAGWGGSAAADGGGHYHQQQDHGPESPRSLAIAPQIFVPALLNAPATNIAVPFEPNSDTLAAPVDYDDECRVFVGLSTIMKLGLSNGSWITISNSPTASSNNSNKQEGDVVAAHVARLYVLDEISTTNNPDTVYLPPMLAANIGLFRQQQQQQQQQASQNKNLFYESPIKALSLTSSSSPSDSGVVIKPLASTLANDDDCDEDSDSDSDPDEYKKNYTKAPIPYARKVVFSRVSSPLSERRDLDSSIQLALQQWLTKPIIDSTANKAKKKKKMLRIVRKGDLVALPVSPRKMELEMFALDSIAKQLYHEASSNSRSSPEENNNRGEGGDLLSHHELGNDIDNIDQVPLVGYEDGDVVFFRITEADAYSGSPFKNRDEENDSDSDTENDSDSDSDDEDVDSLRGQFGCLIDPNVTQVILGGAEHSLVPYVQARTYYNFKYGIAQDPSDQASIDSQPTAPKILPSWPYKNAHHRLYQLLRINLHPLAHQQSINCTILLKGPQGSGKSHIIHEVASILGVHVYELNCYKLSKDTPKQTSESLRLYIKNCARYTPAILILRSIEGLFLSAHKSSSANSDDAGGGGSEIASVLKASISGLSSVLGSTKFPLTLIATTSAESTDKLPKTVVANFRHEIAVSVPDKDTRKDLLVSILSKYKKINLSPNVDLGNIAQQTASFVARDLKSLILRAARSVWQQTTAAATATATTGIWMSTGITLTATDLSTALASTRSSMSDTLGVPKIPNVKWDDVGGLGAAKKDILDTIQLPLEQPHLFSSGMHTRSGLLFYGPPGTGKTLLAKAVATECGLNFFSVKGPELLNMYIGESEANVRRVFQKARDASPCVVFFDELDSLAPKRGNQGDSGGVMDRVVSQLLAELDGMSSSSGSGGGSSSSSSNSSNKESFQEKGTQDSSNNSGGDDESSSSKPPTQVFVIGATNRPDLLDPALLRPGRFDKLVYLGVSDTHDAQLHILNALTRKFHLSPDLDLKEIAQSCPFNYTGADFYALCSDALLKAMLDTVDMVDALVKKWNQDPETAVKELSDRLHLQQGEEISAGNTTVVAMANYPVPMTPQYYLDHIASPDQKKAIVTKHHFLRALDELVPSVPADELKRYQALRDQFDATKNDNNNNSSSKKKQQQKLKEVVEKKTSLSKDMFSNDDNNKAAAVVVGKGKEKDMSLDEASNIPNDVPAVVPIGTAYSGAKEVKVQKSMGKMDPRE